MGNGTTAKKIKLYVLIPDKASGDYFNEKLRRHNIETEYGYYYIHPRIVNNKLTTSKKIIADINGIFKTFSDRTRSVVIACNTLQLWLDDIRPEYKKHVKIYTTFEVCDWKFRKNKRKPLWLGTTALVEKTTDFPTLLDYQNPIAQNKVQELVWRIKMLYGDDIQTAFDCVRADSSLSKEAQQEKIAQLQQEIVAELKKADVREVILGCTELPMVFRNSFQYNIRWFDPAEVLAEYIKHQSVLIFFAGGTISSFADRDGTLIGGHVFDLVEKLSSHMPGSFRHLNITRSGIIYSGLSENMTIGQLESIWDHVQDALEAGPARIVITHGTDAMEQTAQYIRKKLIASKKIYKTVIIFTGSNIQTGDDRTDAWRNLRFAINVRIPQGETEQVFIAFDRHLVPAQDATKVFIFNKNRYVSKKSREYLRHMNALRNRLEKYKKLLINTLKRKPDMKGLMVYEVNKIRADHSEFIQEAAVKKPKAVLFKLYHSGTANTKDKQTSVADLVARLTREGVACFGATETGEPTDLRSYESSVELLDAGMVPLYNMLFDVALFKLSLLDISKLSRSDIIEKMLKNCTGEIDEKYILREDIEKLQESIRKQV